MNNLKKSNNKQNHSIGIVGATGAVGLTLLKVFNDYKIKPKNLRLFASEKSEGKTIVFNDKKYKIENLEKTDFKGLDVVFFSAGTNISKIYCKKAVEAGATVIDNSNAHRMQQNVPLVIPEVNPNKLKEHNGIIANPNCSTIQMLVAIAPIHKINPVKRIVVSTYQSVSGTGLKAVELLKKQAKEILEGKNASIQIYPHPIAFNLFPHIDIFTDSGLCREEEKMINETHKILDENIAVCPTTVRVPVISCHSESINLQLTEKVDMNEILNALQCGEDIKIMDEPGNGLYPTPLLCQNKNEVFVGRIRRDYSIDNAINLWVVADNLRRGAAVNAVKIYLKLIEYELL